MRNEWTDQHGRFSLTDEGSSSCYDGFGTGDTERPEEELGEFDDEPLENTAVIQKLDECDEEDDGWNNTSKEPSSD